MSEFVENIFWLMEGTPLVAFLILMCHVDTFLWLHVIFSNFVVDRLGTDICEV